MAAPSGADAPGSGLIVADLIGTGAFVATAVAAAVLLRPAVQAPAVAVSGVLFVGGCVTFLWGFLAAVERSRTEAIELSSLFFLKQSAPPAVRRALFGLLTVQVVAAIATASVRPFTSLAFGVMAPLWGLGLLTLWSGRYGVFDPKPAHPGLAAWADEDSGSDEPGVSDGHARHSPGVRRDETETAGGVVQGSDRPE